MRPQAQLYKSPPLHSEYSSSTSHTSNMPTSTITRKIGNSTFPAIGFGAMGISSYYGAVESDEECFKARVLDAAHAAGDTFWDPADIYGDSEELLGKWACLSAFILQRLLPRIREDSKKAAELSLKKLGVDYIDLYYLHRADVKVPIEHTVATLAEFVKLGLLVTVRELGIQVIAFSSLGCGLLTGQYKSPDDFEDSDFRKGIPRYSAQNFPNILKLADGLKSIGAKCGGATAGQVALAWLLAQGEDIIPIPGTKKIKYLEENIAASKLKLSAENVKDVHNVASQAEASQGERYPAGMLTTLFVDTPALS
ncbi:NADP-dependent oxidoreductase domain-containing protein [Mycena olivaceomarginata]|nr:NADP-dependent oxidoreductase domain-containing protein [Mycena olivaceomarginata]